MRRVVRADTSPPRRTRLLLVVVAATVLGFWSMHALDLHGTSADASAPAATHATSPADVHAPADADADAPAAPGHGTGDMVMLCVGMLAAAAGASLLAHLLRRVPRTGLLLARTKARANRSHAHALSTRTGSGPPHVWEFSVIRC